MRIENNEHVRDLFDSIPCYLQMKKADKISQKSNIKYALGLFESSPIKARNLMNPFPAEVVIFHYPRGQKNQSIIA